MEDEVTPQSSHFRRNSFSDAEWDTATAAVSRAAAEATGSLPRPCSGVRPGRPGKRTDPVVGGQASGGSISGLRRPPC